MEGCVDANGDGVVDWNEFWCFMEPLGVTEEEAKAAFIACDTDKDGTLDADEFATACAKYYYDREMSTFADFYGAFHAPVTPLMRRKWSRVFDMKDLSGFVSGNTFEAVLAMSVKLNKKIMEGCADANGDGVVDWNEFWCFMEPLGVTEEGAKA